MDIKYAILGFLSWRPMTGYDLKKLFADSPTLHWSGNNNQIYRTLVELHEGGLVASEVQHQEHYPSRKVYTLTEEGRSELRAWLMSPPELPQLRSEMLVQLAWADLLAPDELDALLGGYEREVEMQLVMARERRRRGTDTNPGRTPRESYLWQMTYERHISFYENELGWVRTVRAELGER